MTALTPEEVEGRLQAVVAKRGYLLPHHGLLAITHPDMLSAYDTMYTGIALTRRTVSEHAKEFVWLAVLTATEEALATHHIRKYREAGGSEAEIEAAVLLAAYGQGSPSLEFVETHWAKQIPGFDREAVYRSGLTGLMAGRAIPPGWVEMAMLAVATCRRRWFEVDVHIRGAYAAGVAESDLVEALVIAMFPGSVPNFVDACRIWRDLVRENKVPASESFRIWATLEAGTPDHPVFEIRRI